MENLVFTTFVDAKKATDGLKKLHELDQIGDITIYNLAIIKKNDDGSITLLQHEGPDTSDQPVEGAMVGSLIGLLAGPVGMAVGLLTGVMVGSADAGEAGDVTRQFVDKAGKQLLPGGLAIVMDVEEDTTFMIDSYMGAYQGVTIHSPIADEYDENDKAQWKELEAEINDAERELESAVEKDKSHVKARLNALKEKRARLMEQIKAKASKKQKHWSDKIRILDEKITRKNNEAHKKLKAQQEKLQEELHKYHEAVAFAFD